MGEDLGEEGDWIKTEPCSNCGREGYILKDKWYCRFCANKSNRERIQDKFKKGEYRPSRMELEDDTYELEKIIERRIRRRPPKNPDKESFKWKILWSYWTDRTHKTMLFDTGEGLLLRTYGGSHSVVESKFKDRNHFTEFYLRPLLQKLGYKPKPSSRRKNGKGMYYI